MTRSSTRTDAVVLRSSPRILAPDWVDRLKTVPAGALLLILVFVLIVAIHGASQTGLVLAPLAVIVLFGGPLLLKFVNTSVVITPEYVEGSDSIRRTKRCLRRNLVRLVIVRIAILGPRFSLTRVLLVGRDGRTCLSLQIDAWSDEQLNRIYQLLGLPVEEIPQPLSPREVDRLHRGGASVVLKYWPAFAIGVFLVAFLALGFVLSAVQH
jgi:hypothetical protein